MLHSWGQYGGCFVWLNQSIEKRSCRLMFWWYSSVNAGESLAANPDRKLVGGKKAQKMPNTNSNKKAKPSCNYFLFLVGLAFLPPHSKSSLFHVILPIFLWTIEIVLLCLSLAGCGVKRGLLSDVEAVGSDQSSSRRMLCPRSGASLGCSTAILYFIFWSGSTSSK